MSLEDDKHDMDLPLSSSIKSRYIQHYLMDLKCSFEDKTFTGYIIVFSKYVGIPAPSSKVSEAGKYTGISTVTTEASEVSKDVGIPTAPSETHEALFNHQTVDTEKDHHSSNTNKSIGGGDNSKDEKRDIDGFDTGETDLNRSEHCSNDISKCPTDKIKGTCDNFVLVLDCSEIKVDKVEELDLSESDKISALTDYSRYKVMDIVTSCGTASLEFEVREHCIRVWKEGVLNGDSFPDVIKISYSTNTTGQSLKWTRDQDGQECVYTHGHWINNRSWFPSQDIPGAMASWQAWIHVPVPTTVLMTGDQNPEVWNTDTGFRTHYYYSKMDMPSSTLALAVGHWNRVDCTTVKDSPADDTCLDGVPYRLFSPSCLSDLSRTVLQTYIPRCLSAATDLLGPYPFYRLDILIVPPSFNSLGLASLVDETVKDEVPYRLFSPSCLSDVARTVLHAYIPRCLSAATYLLGPYPFYRLDILIVPPSFNSLGMASPSLLFLSQSVLSADQGMLVRVSHEISHTWFGILIGPKDWSEEWLSEGFCTYTEWIIHTAANQMDDEEAKETRAILDILKYRTLKSEINTVHTNLQTLRSSAGDSGPEKLDAEVSYVKNGMNPEKGFMQLHYLKGYFLLCYLENIVGTEKFCEFIKTLVEKYHHQLINSQEVLSLFIGMFPDKGLNIEEICHGWLDNAGIPQFIETYTQTDSTNSMIQAVIQNFIETYTQTDSTNSMIQAVIQNVEVVNQVNKTYTALHWRKRQRLDLAEAFKLKKMNMAQTLYFLEILLESKKIHVDILTSLNRSLQLSTSNPDILHKWCELVVKYKVEDHYNDVKNFLVNHQAMGVYLFGELILSKDKQQRQVAERAFNMIKHDLDHGVYTTVCLMIYGTEHIT